MYRFVGILGLLSMLALAFAFSTARRAIRLKTLAWGVGLQFAFAFLVLRFEAGRAALAFAGAKVTVFLEYSYAGSQFIFGDLGKKLSPQGFIFAFQVLPTIIFISAFFAVLYHFGIMQFIIKQFAKVMKLMGASGAESLNVAASIFMGQTEAPLTIRPFLPDLTRSELMTVMTSGMAHVSGGIMAAYIAFGIDPKHLLSAVIMTAPGTLLMAKMLVPETEQAKTAGKVVMSAEEEKTEKEENLLGAIARGTTDGLHLALNIAAMLISFLALIALVNGIFGGYTGPGTKTVIPSRATAKLSFRLVPNQQPAHILDGLHRFIAERLPADCTVTYAGEGGSPAVGFDTSTPIFQAAAMRLLISFDSMGTSSSMPRRSMRRCMRSPPKMRSRSSCSDR